MNAPPNKIHFVAIFGIENAAAHFQDSRAKIHSKAAIHTKVSCFSGMPWEREGEPLHTKYMYVCHAELNAILNSAHNNLKGARVYVTLFPCNECTKAIIQSGIAEVVYYGDKYHDSDSSIAARFMFQKAGVKLTPYTPSGRKAELEL